MSTIQRINVGDRRFPLKDGAGADAVHTTPIYAYAVAELHTDSGLTGIGLAFTLGNGNHLVCQAIEVMAEALVGEEIEALMANFGERFRQLANEPNLRWLGPHKGVVHLALASVVNACFDLWAKHRGVPLWRLLLDLSPEALVNTLDFSYLEEVLTEAEALAMLEDAAASRSQREHIIQAGYPGYDTSVGWFHYDDATIRQNALRAMDMGFDAMKLKIGSVDGERDIRRAYLIRETVGEDARVMVDVNQQWNYPTAVAMCDKLAGMRPYWVEEPMHPDDVTAHQQLAETIAPIPVALGEHVANRVQFKNFMVAKAAAFIQVDCTRVGGVSEFLVVSLLARKFGLKVVPHVGDMGQIHQHLVLVNHIAFGLDAIFLEYIPHLREHFRNPARVEGGVYHTPQEIGASSDLI